MSNKPSHKNTGFRQKNPDTSKPMFHSRGSYTPSPSAVKFSPTSQKSSATTTKKS